MSHIFGLLWITLQVLWAIEQIKNVFFDSFKAF